MRTETEILSEMDATLATLDAAQKPTATGEVGVFVWLKKSWCLLVQDIERRVDTLLSQVQQAVDSRPVGSLAWYVEQVKLFQYGDAVGVYAGGVVGYAVTDPAKRLIVQASATEDGNGRILIKVAKQASPTALAPLTDTELSAARAYVAAVRFAGVGVDVVSRAADELRLSATAEIDPQVLSLSAGGSSLSDASLKPIEAALQTYLRELPFDSVISWTALTDYMQTVAGVTDFQVTATAIRPAGATTWSEFTRETLSYAGHLILSTESVLRYV